MSTWKLKEEHLSKLVEQIVSSLALDRLSVEVDACDGIGVVTIEGFFD